MQINSIKGVQFPFGSQFILSFNVKDVEALKGLLCKCTKTEECSSISDNEMVLSKFTTNIFNSFWNISSINITANQATFIFRDARFQNVFTVLASILILVAHIFVFQESSLSKGVSNSGLTFMFFGLFFYIARCLVKWRICLRLNRVMKTYENS